MASCYSGARGEGADQSRGESGMEVNYSGTGRPDKPAGTGLAGPRAAAGAVSCLGGSTTLNIPDWPAQL